MEPRRDGQMEYKEARLDVEMFGHAYAPDRLLDGTVRHPAAQHMVNIAAEHPGAAAAAGVGDKERRYPAQGGKVVWPCAVETWGTLDAKLDLLLAELDVLASRRQKERGIVPSKWRARRRTMISVHMAMHAAKAILTSVPAGQRPCRPVRKVDERR